ncbi:hypothetical protein N7510_006224 [Penicillium lagena]|uniref:uncharacterized protein n=1 Tax=Penicillium lagena TaxID=94218 RepID=UPI002541FFAB|nr:uncharacterized protein N7510_006224 [Penicillium lagena]KAJ5613030.1 hypothetical protein N7510_006224 [Penicillium lagena]
MVSYFGSNVHEQDAIFTEAAQILDSMASSPSCNRIAAMRLLTSCQTVGNGKGSDADTHEVLDLIRSVYAARLAICELQGTGTVIPSACIPVTVSPPAAGTGRFGFPTKSAPPDTGRDSIPMELLEPCLQALESRPQWWTSYSNSRQNAMVICQATRMEREKEELLDLHRSIVKSSVKLNTGLHEALLNATAQAVRNQAFMESVDALQTQFVSGLEEAQVRFKGSFADLLQLIKSGITTVTGTVSTALNHLQTESATLEKSIRSTSDQAHLLQKTLRTVNDEALVRSKDVLLAHEQNALIHKDLANSLSLSLESLRETDVVNLYRRIESVDAALEWLITRMDLILSQENKMIEQSETTARELQKAQLLQSEAILAQSEAQETTLLNANNSKALIDQTAIIAADLLSKIEETSLKFRQTSSFLGYLWGIGDWISGALCVFLILALISGMKNGFFECLFQI